MDRELFTRNFMTGWVLLAGFLASWLPTQESEVVRDPFKWFTDVFQTTGLANDIGPRIGLTALAVLSTPVLGYTVSAVVLLYLYLRKYDPYMNVSRTKIPLPCDEADSETADTVRRQCNHFAYLVYKNGPELLIDWGRRRHTARFLGYNWATAAIMGFVFGATLAKWKPVPAVWILLAFCGLLLMAGYIERRWWDMKRVENSKRPGFYRPNTLFGVLAGGGLYSIFLVSLVLNNHQNLVFGILLLALAAMMTWLGFKAEQEAEAVEQWWAKDLQMSA